jgi:Holliday junction resolvase RusA-like endonuclease
MKLKLSLPIYTNLVYKGKKPERVSLSMNGVYKRHFRDISRLKRIQATNTYIHLMQSGQMAVRLSKPVKITFQLFKATNHSTDKSNFYAIQAKFAYDALTKLKIWPDDNDDFIKEEVLLPTEMDRENPRVEFVIEEIDD